MNRSPRFPWLFTDIIVTGKYAGRKVVALQTLTGDAGLSEGETGKIGVLSLHAGVAAEAHKSLKLENLSRHIARPVISEERLSISPQGRVRLELKILSRNSIKTEWQHPFRMGPGALYCHGVGARPAATRHLSRFHGMFTQGVLLAALRASLRLLNYIPDEFVLRLPPCAPS